MKRILLGAIVYSVVVTSSVFAQATSPLRGMELYENHCTVCHASKVHIREKRKAKSLAQVKTWVERWAKELKLQWTDAEIKEVLSHLNRRYYKY